MQRKLQFMPVRAIHAEGNSWGFRPQFMPKAIHFLRPLWGGRVYGDFCFLVSSRARARALRPPVSLAAITGRSISLS